MATSRTAEGLFISRFAARLLERLRASGAPIDGLLRELGHSRQTPTGLELKREQLVLLCQRAEEYLDQRPLGVLLGQSAARGTYGLVEFLGRSATTLREGLESVLRFQRLESSALEYSFDEADGWATIEHAGLPEAPVFNEYALALLLETAKQVGVEVRPVRAWFAHRSADPKELARLLGAGEVYLGHSTNGMLFEAEVLDRPLRTADRALHAMLEEEAGRALVTHVHPSDLVARVRDLLRVELEAGEPTLARTAKTLALGERTLQRRLAERGTTFFEVLDEVRCKLAPLYLSNRELGVEQVALRLGYADRRALTRAVRRWTGKSVADLRRAFRA